ncbi:MAG TPA: PadR family transcriptional regulator [Nitrolancea sp.]
MPKRKISNPLALAVLSCLYERPMHPYEIGMTLRHRSKQESIKLNYGSLYSVVESLERLGWIASRETEREGRRPERTIYELTERGEVELFNWLRELLAIPVKEYTQFEAGLSLMAGLAPEEVEQLLRQRIELLTEEIKNMKELDAMVPEEKLPRLFRIENEYWQMLREAELAWVTRLADDIASGEMAGVDLWREFIAAHKAQREGNQ